MNRAIYQITLSVGVFIFQGWAHIPTGWALLLPPPAQSTDADHPGSKIYSYTFSEKLLQCERRNVAVFVPQTATRNERFPVVVYGHGQALSLQHYRATFEHLARKGIASVFPDYDTGFFDQDWQRMGHDYNRLTNCAIQSLSPQLAGDQLVYSGHSKGAYVASIAAGLATHEKSQPRALILFAPAGSDTTTLPKIARNCTTTVVYSDADTVVDRQFSQTIYELAGSQLKQLIVLKSYNQTSPQLKADHFWPMTSGSFYGGGPPSSFHYYGAWKWLTAASLDLKAGQFDQPYLYGSLAAEKGLPGFEDEITRSWQ